MGAYELMMTQCSSLSAHPKIAILKSWGHRAAVAPAGVQGRELWWGAVWGFVKAHG